MLFAGSTPYCGYDLPCDADVGEVGECGACSVLLNGRCVDSCIYLTVWAQGKEIVTVEGLKDENNGDLTDVQKEFIKQAAVQCGFCTPGFILKAVEIVGANKPYTRDEIKELMGIFVVVQGI